METKIKTGLAKLIYGRINIMPPKGIIDLYDLFNKTLSGPFCGRLAGSNQFSLENRSVDMVPDFDVNLYYMTHDFRRKELVYYSVTSGIYRELSIVQALLVLKMLIDQNFPYGEIFFFLNQEEKDLFNQYRISAHYGPIPNEDRLVLYAYSNESVKVTRMVCGPQDDRELMSKRFIVF